MLIINIDNDKKLLGIEWIVALLIILQLKTIEKILIMINNMKIIATIKIKIIIILNTKKNDHHYNIHNNTKIINEINRNKITMIKI